MTDTGTGLSPLAQASAHARWLRRTYPHARVLIEPEAPHRPGGQYHYHVMFNGRRVGTYAWGTPVTGRAREAEGETQLEALLAGADRAIDRAVRREQRASESETEIVETAKQIYDAWDQLPDDLKDQIKEQVRRLWDVRGALWMRVLQWVSFMVSHRGLPIPEAVRQAGTRFNLRSQQRRGRSPADVRVRQYHRRQLQRGRVPGRNPQMRGRQQREAEGEAGRLRSPHPRIRIRYRGSISRELEFEAFDPSPPPPGTALLTRFAFARATLSSRHRGTINTVAEAIVTSMPAMLPLHCMFVDVEGHEDEVGDPSRFGQVGLARAEAAARVLADRVAALMRRLPPGNQRDVQITISSAGPSRPIRSNVTADGRALNRRVEIRAQARPCGLIA